MMGHLLTRRELLRSTTLGTVALTGLLAESAGVVAAGADADESPLTAKAPHFPAKAKRVIHLL